MKKLILLLALILPLSGCDALLPIDYSKIKQNQSEVQTSSEVNSDIVAEIKAASKDIPPADKLILYKMYDGLASLVKSAVPTTTIKAHEYFDNVSTIYGWQKEKYPTFTDATEKVLQNKTYTGDIDYSLPQKISDIKENFTKINRSIAEGLK